VAFVFFVIVVRAPARRNVVIVVASWPFVKPEGQP